MTYTNDSDTIVVLERRNRRRFIRQGSAYLVAGASALLVGEALAADCDRGQSSYCTDSDSGENSDSVGCGKCGRTDTVPSAMQRGKSEKLPSVARIIVD